MCLSALIVYVCTSTLINYTSHFTDSLPVWLCTDSLCVYLYPNKLHIPLHWQFTCLSALIVYVCTSALKTTHPTSLTVYLCLSITSLDASACTNANSASREKVIVYQKCPSQLTDPASPSMSSPQPTAPILSGTELMLIAQHTKHCPWCVSIGM